MGAFIHQVGLHIWSTHRYNTLLPKQTLYRLSRATVTGVTLSFAYFPVVHRHSDHKLWGLYQSAPSV